MMAFQGRIAQELYYHELQALIDQGERVEVRGKTTMELLNVVTIVDEPIHPCILIPNRRWNPWLALSEGLWILAGRNDVKSLLPYNGHIVDFSDDGETLYGAYGLRMAHQVDSVVQRLRKDPSDRRAVLQIWDSTWPQNGDGGDDLMTDSKDPPCNNLVYFKLREGRLHMTVINRSNDIHWGLYAVNLPTFAMFQQYIAARLGVAVGTQTHFSNSLHFYTSDHRANVVTSHMLADHSAQEYPDHSLMFEGLQELERHWNFSNICGAVLDDGDFGISGPRSTAYDFMYFARDFLRMYRARRWHPEVLDQKFADWIQAGQNFVDVVWGRHGS